MALELVKYQTVMCLLFARYPAVSVIEYDRLFCQAAARDRTMHWDCPKEDIYVWALTQSHDGARPHTGLSNHSSSATSSSLPFRERAPITARLGPPVKPNTTTVDRATHTSSGKEICKCFNLGKCTKGDDCIFAHISWHSWIPPARATTLAGGAPSSSELIHHYDTLSLRGSQHFTLTKLTLRSFLGHYSMEWTSVTKAQLAQMMPGIYLLCFNTLIF